MNSYKAAISKLNNNSLKIGSEIVSIKDALNRISSKEVIAKSDYPADDNTAFDGFAVNSKETKNTFQKFKILKTIAAGDNPYIKKVPKLSCIEVMTGAIIKKPFDTIIPIEDIEFFPSKQNAKYIIINKKIKKSEFIRPKGSDYKKGNKIIKKGDIEEYNQSGKIYVTKAGKIVQTIFSIFDFFRLLFIQSDNYYRNEEHNEIGLEINIDERI